MNSSKTPPEVPIKVDVAVKNSADIFVFQVPLMLSVMFAPQSSMVNNNELMAQWQAMPTDPSQLYEVKTLSSKITTPVQIKERLIDNNAYFLEEGRTEQGLPCLYFHIKLLNGLLILACLAFADGTVKLQVKSKVPQVIKCTQQALNFVLSS